MNNDKNSQRHMRARRDVVPDSTNQQSRLAKNRKKAKRNRAISPTKQLLTALAAVLCVLIVGISLWVIFSSPEIDEKQNPFDVGFMSMFGQKRAYTFVDDHRQGRGSGLGVVYTLDDFFGSGLLVGETAGDKVVRNKNSYNILVVGKDRVGANTDVIMVVNFNSATQKISILQIPRDTYVEDPINRGGSKKINAIFAYSYMKNVRTLSKTEASHEALKYLESSIESTFGITVDNYFMIDLNGFVKIIDSIGGVKVNVPFNMYYQDPEQNLYINLKKGEQVLDGDKAEQFVRFRNTYVLGDIGRVSAQKIFLAALVDKLTSPEWFSLESLTSVAGNLIDYTTTGMSLTDLIGYIKKVDFGKLSSDSITFYTAPGEGYFAPSGASFYSLYLDENLEIVNKAFNLYNKDITEKNVTLTEQYRSAYAVGDTTGDTAAGIEDEPPKILTAGGYKPKPPVTTEPEVPTDPEEPGIDEPTDPEIPEEPDIDEPTDPSTPEEPGVEVPEVPEVPEEPTEPTEPGEATEPTEPEVPEEIPETPQEPEEPAEPEEPTEPETPTVSSPNQLHN